MNCICAFCDDVRVMIARAQDVLNAPSNRKWREDLQAKMAPVFDAITKGSCCIRAKE